MSSSRSSNPWQVVSIWYDSAHIEHIVEERWSGGTKSRHLEQKTILKYPEKFKEHYKIPNGIESQPF